MYLCNSGNTAAKEVITKFIAFECWANVQIQMEHNFIND